MKSYAWNEDKNARLKEERGIGFEEILLFIAEGGLLDVLAHPDQARYPGQRIFVVRVEEYAYLVPFVENATGIFLKTIIPSRKATRDYLGSREEEQR